MTLRRKSFSRILTIGATEYQNILIETRLIRGSSLVLNGQPAYAQKYLTFSERRFSYAQFPRMHCKIFIELSSSNSQVGIQFEQSLFVKINQVLNWKNILKTTE